MARGRVVFDGPPAALTPFMMREIYGMTEEELADAEMVTSTSLAGGLATA
jgi:phosphonate transport system ATP-binding protein